MVSLVALVYWTESNAQYSGKNRAATMDDIFGLATNSGTCSHKEFVLF
jgi:hypothetical protein